MENLTSVMVTQTEELPEEEDTTSTLSGAADYWRLGTIGLLLFGQQKISQILGGKEEKIESDMPILDIHDLNQKKTKWKNCLHESWQEGLYYVHPLKENFLIRAERFESFILDEQLNDIVGFIREYMALAEFEVGILKAGNSSFHAGGQANISGTDVSAGGGFSKQFSGNYHLKYADIPRLNTKTDHPWIHHFPEFASVADAVRSGIGSMEKTVEIENSYAVNGELLVLGNGGSASGDENCRTRFYISYTKAGNF